MDDRGEPYRDAVLHATHVLRGQWTVAVLATLATGETQYKDVLAEVNAVEQRTGGTRRLSDRTLTDAVNRMQDDHLIHRREEGRGTSHRVWYSLTPKGRSLLAAIRPLAEWARQYPRADPDAP